MQTVPAVPYALMSHANSFEIGAHLGGLTTQQTNDEIASIAGAIARALHVRKAIRKRCVTGIRSRSLSVEGRLFAEDRNLIEQWATEAAERFG